ncbi:MAG: class I SAM-dependent methyltransferase, partial [Pseudomonadota bacterium]
MDKKLIDLTSFAPTQNLKDRLVERHKRIIDKNLHYIKNKSVLDLASNNGRWAYAARVAGATKVLGVEGRDDKVMEARRLIEEAGLEGKVSFCVADIFDWLFNNVEKFDTVLVLGIYYHIMDHYILLRLIKRAQPECIIVDSGFVRTFRSYIWIKRENPNEHLNALPAFQGQKEEVVGHISLGLMNQFAWNCGYICEPVLWDPHE